MMRALDPRTLRQPDSLVHRSPMVAQPRQRYNITASAIGCPVSVVGVVFWEMRNTVGTTPDGASVGNVAEVDVRPSVWTIAF